MKIIKLTQNKETMVDDGDFEWLSKYDWRYNYGSYGGEYAVTAINQKTVRIHRLIMNAQAGQEMDHINGNGLDNRRENLRFCSRTENNRNRGRQKLAASGYKGVSKRKNRWKAWITLDSKQIHIGMYSMKEEAARAYNKAAKEYHGEFARFNNVN